MKLKEKESNFFVLLFIYLYWTGCLLSITIWICDMRGPAVAVYTYKEQILTMAVNMYTPA